MYSRSFGQCTLDSSLMGTWGWIGFREKSWLHHYYKKKLKTSGKVTSYCKPCMITYRIQVPILGVWQMLQKIHFSIHAKSTTFLAYNVPYASHQVCCSFHEHTGSEQIFSSRENLLGYRSQTLLPSLHGILKDLWKRIRPKAMWWFPSWKRHCNYSSSM